MGRWLSSAIFRATSALSASGKFPTLVTLRNRVAYIERE